MAIDVPATITAVVGGLTPVGLGIAWIWRKVERRFKQIETKLEKCQEQHVEAHTLSERLWTCVRIMVAELERTGSTSPALNMVRGILREAYPIVPVPLDMAETVEKAA